jgi:GH25 family lysozyme M1 (1,4-beta-N-acetylmuramidase)
MRYQKVFFCAALALGLVSDRASADLLGVDVSTHQGAVNWTTMKNDGVSFAFTKATEGVDFIDARFTQNMNGARNAGVVIGPYHFARPDSSVGTLAEPVKQDAINEANDFVDAIAPFYASYPGEYLRPVLDVEALPSSAEINTIAEQRTYLSAWIKDFNSVVQSRLGTDVIIYLNGNYAQTYITADIASYDLWFAKPNGLSSPPTDANMGVWSDWVFWQYSWTGNLGGENPLDLNTYRGTLNDLQEYVVGGEPPLVGDYNDDGVVDAADYTVWRDTWTRFNTTDMRADGNNNGVIDTGDRDVWAANFGATSNAAVAVPEPTAIAVVSVTIAMMGLRRRDR